MTKAGGKKLIAERVEEFEKNKAALTKKGHGETNIRTNYIDVLFESLGWNMKSHYDVVREFSQKDTSGTKKVDYAFKVNGKLKFFVEAKEASVDLVNDKDAIYQAKRYAYSTNGRAPIVILTDFEEFRVFNVLKAPDYNNTDRELLKKYCFEYTQYLENWDLLWDTFSKEAVENGSLDAIRGKIDKNTKTMDVDFLEQITDWRETLAKNIALRNKELSVEELNEAVQRILDRLLFIRNLEDREIEPENTLLDKTKAHEDIYKSIIPIFRNLDNVYNGLLFKKHFSEDLIVDDKALKDIIKNMCYPVSPFQFDVIEPEILGRIYEKFLGSKIRLTESHQAKVEEKMEVRKAGGVYYTPEYIVDYIVKNTVGKKIEGLTPEEIKKIKIVDPACGSGSFLLGAYSYILDYHARWYSENKKEKVCKNDYYINKDGELKVNLEKRGDILRNNIFGVDIDKEATEVAIMSLYLKMLDDGFDKGERDLFFIKGHVLPDMTNNVKCGNSLIGTDYFEGKLDFDIDEMKEIKPFDWDKEFADIFKNGGFDCVIGNPPYFSLSSFNNNTHNYLKRIYEVYDKSSDIYCLFFEISIKISREHGRIGLITSSQWLQTNYGKILRLYFVKVSNPKLLINFGGVKIFQEATVDTTILIIDKEKCDNKLEACHFKKDYVVDSNIDDYINRNKLLITVLDSDKWIIADNSLYKLKDKIQKKGQLLKNLNVKINYGIKSGLNEAFIIDLETKNRLCKEDPKSIDIIKPILRGRDIHRYCINYANLFLIVSKNGINVQKDHPAIYQHFCKFSELIKKRSDQGENWWNLRACSYYEQFNEEKLIYPETTVRRSEFYYDTDGFYIDKTAFMIVGQNLKFLNGILSSKLMEWYLESELRLLGKNSIQYSKQFIEQIPIAVHDISEHNQIVALVDQMLQTQKDSRNAKSEADKKLYEQKISMIDKKIDELVYKLYGLTEEEIRIVEG